MDQANADIDPRDGEGRTPLSSQSADTGRFLLMTALSLCAHGRGASAAPGIAAGATSQIEYTLKQGPKG